VKKFSRGLFIEIDSDLGVLGILGNSILRRKITCKVDKYVIMVIIMPTKRYSESSSFCKIKVTLELVPVK
jgi:hypothetical protein